MKTDIYTLSDVKAELVKKICLQYIDKLFREDKISEKHAELLTERFMAGCTGKRE